MSFDLIEKDTYYAILLNPSNTLTLDEDEYREISEEEMTDIHYTYSDSVEKEKEMTYFLVETNKIYSKNHKKRDMVFAFDKKSFDLFLNNKSTSKGMKWTNSIGGNNSGKTFK